MMIATTSRTLLGEKYKLLQSVGEVDLAGTFADNVRCRLHVFRQQGHISSAIRILADRIPELRRLIAACLLRIRTLSERIVIVAGERAQANPRQ